MRKGISVTKTTKKGVGELIKEDIPSQFTKRFKTCFVLCVSCNSCTTFKDI